MREIFFRAKAINRNPDRKYRTNYKNGDWVYGLISKLYDEETHKRYNFLFAEMTNESGVSGIDVDYKTIGQYTGLKDKNGNKVFEGDIVRWKECDHWAPDDGIVSGYVLYVDGQWLIQRPNIRSYLWWAHSSCEIIGNIYDSELIGGEENAEVH